MKYYILYKQTAAGVAHLVTHQPDVAAKDGWNFTAFPAFDNPAQGWHALASYLAGDDPPFRSFKHYCFEDSRGPVEVHLQRIGAEIAEVAGGLCSAGGGSGVWQTRHGTFSSIGLARRMARIFLETPQP